jgi:UrcA family protein
MAPITTVGNETHKVRTLFPRMKVAMTLCAFVLAAGAGVASAATPKDDAPSISVKYDPATLQTDRGARQLYNRLAEAAAQLYPSSSPHFVPTQIREWREQSISRAVMTINSPKLVAVYNGTLKNG